MCLAFGYKVSSPICQFFSKLIINLMRFKRKMSTPLLCPVTSMMILKASKLEIMVGKNTIIEIPERG